MACRMWLTDNSDDPEGGHNKKSNRKRNNKQGNCYCSSSPPKKVPLLHNSWEHSMAELWWAIDNNLITQWYWSQGQVVHLRMDQNNSRRAIIFTLTGKAVRWILLIVRGRRRQAHANQGSRCQITRCQCEWDGSGCTWVMFQAIGDICDMAVIRWWRDRYNVSEYRCQVSVRLGVGTLGWKRPRWAKVSKAEE